MEVDPDLTIHHLIFPEAVSLSDFASTGIAGGHQEATLQVFLQLHPEYHFVCIREVEVLGTTMRLYRQYMFTGPNPPAYSNKVLRPSGSKIPDGWIVCQVMKSTVEDLSGWLHNGVLAFEAWDEFDPKGPASQKVGRGLYKGAKGEKAKPPLKGMEFGGRVEFVEEVNKWLITQLVPHIEEIESLL